MKFRIRFADQIVGLFIIFAIAAITFVIVMLGSSQRWFANDTSFYTEFNSGSGISRNMPVSYKGFTIGTIQSFVLNKENQVEVVFLIYEQYRDRVKTGSIVELQASPIGLGSQFIFHPGNGADLVADNGFIPNADSVMARNYIRQGLANEPKHDDSISATLNMVNTTLDGLNILPSEVETAFVTGTDATVMGQMAGSINRTLAMLPETIDDTVYSLLADIDSIKNMLDETLTGLNPIIADIGALTAMLAAPDGTIAAVLDGSGDVYTSIAGSLESVSWILAELEKTAAFLPRQLPQLAGLIADLRVTLNAAEDVLVALSNNPLLRNGVPAQVEIQPIGTAPRDIRF